MNEVFVNSAFLYVFNNSKTKILKYRLISKCAQLGVEVECLISVLIKLSNIQFKYLVETLLEVY